jgi:hypothetical protein
MRQPFAMIIFVHVALVRPSAVHSSLAFSVVHAGGICVSGVLVQNVAPFINASKSAFDVHVKPAGQVVFGRRFDTSMAPAAPAAPVAAPAAPVEVPAVDAVVGLVSAGLVPVGAVCVLVAGVVAG